MSTKEAGRQRVLVTGASGFIGGFLVRALSRTDCWIRCLVHPEADYRGILQSGAELVYGDIVERSSLEKAVEGVDVVYHLAAAVRPFKCFCRRNELFDKFVKINVCGTSDLMHACMKSRVKKFIYYSSIAAAGIGSDISELSVPAPVSEYGKSKLMAEELLLKAYKEQGFPVVVVRPGQVYGPGNRPMSILFRMAKAGVLPSFGKGGNLASFIYIDNLIDATLLIADKGNTGEVYFAVDDYCSIRGFACEIASELGVRLSGFYLPRGLVRAALFLKDSIEKLSGISIYPLKMDMGRSTYLAASNDFVCSNAKIRRELGYKPRVSMKDGIRASIRWYKENGLL